MKEETDLSKTDKKFGKHDLESTFFVVGVFMVLVYLLNFGAVNDAIGSFLGRCLWLVKPYSTISFEKIQRTDPDLKYVDIIKDGFRGLPETINISYNKNKIFLQKSIYDKDALNSISIDGQIKEVRCFFSGELNWDYYMKRDDQIATDRYGLYLYCIYQANGEQRLSCYQIGQNNFERYYYIKPYKDGKTIDQDKAWTELQKYIWESYPYKAFDNRNETKRNEYIDAFNNFKHPGTFLRKKFDIVFDGFEFAGFLGNYNNGTYYLVLNKNNSMLELRRNTNNSVFSSISVPKAANVASNRGIENVYCQVFDGRNLFFYKIYDDELKFEYMHQTSFNENTDKTLISLTKIDQLGSYVFRSFVIESQKLYFVDTYDKKTIFLKNITNPVDYGYLYYVNPDNSSTIVESQDFTSVTIPYRFFHQQSFDYRPDGYKRLNTGFFYGDHGQYLVAGKSSVDLSEIKIFLFTKTDIFSLNTFGIDEPVDETYITNENDKLTVYFMNKNSIYRWQNSQNDISNLKFRKLDLQPEPIKTIKEY